MSGEPEELVRAHVARLYRRPRDHEDDFEPAEKDRVALVELSIVGLQAWVR